MNAVDINNDVLTEPPVKVVSQSGFEETFMKHLADLVKVQKSFEERQALFETRMEKKIDDFLNGQPRMQGPSGSNQNQSRQYRHQEGPNLSIQNQFHQQHQKGPSRSTQNRFNQQQEAFDNQEDEPDWEALDQLDENFPLDDPMYVPELEYKMRTDLEFHLLLVIVDVYPTNIFSILASASECCNFILFFATPPRFEID